MSTSPPALAIAFKVSAPSLSRRLLQVRPPSRRSRRNRRAPRFAHNHWSPTRLCEALSEYACTGILQTHIETVVEHYATTATPAYGTAAAWALTQLAA